MFVFGKENRSNPLDQISPQNVTDLHACKVQSCFIYIERIVRNAFEREFAKRATSLKIPYIESCSTDLNF